MTIVLSVYSPGAGLPVVYALLNAVHVAGVIVWLGALLCLCTVLLIHAQSLRTGTSLSKFRAIESDLFWYFTVPGATVALMGGLGMFLLQLSLFLSQGWMHAKLTLVLGLLVLTVLVGRRVLASSDDPTQIQRPPRYVLYRTIALVLGAGALALVYLRPF